MLQSMGSQRVRHDLATDHQYHQETVEDRGPWRATVHGGHKESDMTEQQQQKHITRGGFASGQTANEERER